MFAYIPQRNRCCVAWINW